MNRTSLITISGFILLLAATTGWTQEIILDNGQAGTSSTGSWLTSVAVGSYGNTSVYAKTPGAAYNFEAPLTGLHRVYIWFTTHSTREKAAQIKVYNGDVLLNAFSIDQSAGGGQWYLLDDYEFTGSARVVVQSSSATQTVSADAVKFVYVDPYVFEPGTEREFSWDQEIKMGLSECDKDCQNCSFVRWVTVPQGIIELNGLTIKNELPLISVTGDCKGDRETSVKWIWEIVDVSGAVVAAGETTVRQIKAVLDYPAGSYTFRVKAAAFGKESAWATLAFRMAEKKTFSIGDMAGPSSVK